MVFNNGQQFVSQKFEDFCIHNHIQHLTTTLIHADSNSEMEHFVHTFKTQMRKSASAASCNDTLLSFLLHIGYALTLLGHPCCGLAYMPGSRLGQNVVQGEGSHLQWNAYLLPPPTCALLSSCHLQK
ncbi:uncharacterized protein LOC126335886 [Schistocerca gregaria]|uniref:uncharacterized protein LOC126335886 n=1 Tax=Schistocerca gregaria TaxID=7010 RepID=UPI00211E8072|nr:uncharacterized protein LOC126335886 [Schistocerca gregaria]